MQARTLTTCDPQRIVCLDEDDIKENSLIYLYQLNELQKREWSSWCRQITTLGIFNEGATHWRNREWFGHDHFTRLINQIEIVQTGWSKGSDEYNIQNMLDTYKEAFSGCLMINAMGSEIGKLSSYHVMLRRWMSSITGMGFSRIERETLGTQWKKYNDFLFSIMPEEEREKVIIIGQKKHI